MGANKATKKQRYELYKYAYTILAQNQGEKSIKTIYALLAMAKNTHSASRADTHLDRIIDIAIEQDKPKFVDDMKFEAASLLSRAFSHKKYHDAKNYLQEAWRALSSKLA
jgi:hypothetical protein